MNLIRKIIYPYPKSKYSTKQLVDMIEARMFHMHSTGYGMVCHVNTQHCIQCRGKELRRVLKKRPDWELRGRRIVTKHKSDS